MFVKEAIALLEMANPEDLLIVASDQEGNSYRSAEVSIGESFYRDEDGLQSIHPDDAPTEYEGHEPFNAVVVW